MTMSLKEAVIARGLKDPKPRKPTLGKTDRPKVFGEYRRHKQIYRYQRYQISEFDAKLTSLAFAGENNDVALYVAIWTDVNNLLP